jgi:creatinine amidohydrolase
LQMADWINLRMPEFEAWRDKHRTVILPVGSVEEHGPHLPLGTDTFHALEVARRIAEARPVLVAPPLYYGLCRSTREHPGTVSRQARSILGEWITTLGPWPKAEAWEV